MFFLFGTEFTLILLIFTYISKYFNLLQIKINFIYINAYLDISTKLGLYFIYFYNFSNYHWTRQNFS